QNFVLADNAAVDGQGALTLSGTTAWTGGEMRGTGAVTNNGTLNISGNDLKKLTGRSIINNSGINWSGGDIQFSNKAVLLNKLNFFATGNTNLLNAGGGAAINNQGTVTVSGQVTSTVQLLNSSNLDVEDILSVADMDMNAGFVYGVGQLNITASFDW